MLGVENMNQSYPSFRRSRKSDPGRLAGFVPDRLASVVSVIIALTAVGLVAGCGTSSSTSSSKPPAASSTVTTPAANSGSSAAPAPVGSSTAPSSATASPAPASTVGNGTLQGSYTFNL